MARYVVYIPLLNMYLSKRGFITTDILDARCFYGYTIYEYLTEHSILWNLGIIQGLQYTF